MESDLSLALVETMYTHREGEFNALISQLHLKSEVKEATGEGLKRMAGSGCGKDQAKAVTLLGALRIPGAEGCLLAIVADRYDDLKLDELKSSVKEYLPEHYYLTSLFGSLILLRSKVGVEKAKIVKEKFDDTWIGASLGAGLARINGRA